MKARRVMTIYSLCLSLIEMPFELRDRARAALERQAVARPRVCLALGETNDILWITRSVIQVTLREQTLTTVARYIGRASAQLFENATDTLSTHSSLNQ